MSKTDLEVQLEQQEKRLEKAKRLAKLYGSYSEMMMTLNDIQTNPAIDSTKYNTLTKTGNSDITDFIFMIVNKGFDDSYINNMKTKYGNTISHVGLKYPPTKSEYDTLINKYKERSSERLAEIEKI